MPTRPPFVKHVSELPDNGGTTWPWTGSDEVLGVRTPLSRPLGLVRVGVHHDVLRPGERSSLPHAERWEEECVYVLEGEPVASIDRERHPLRPGDIAVFAPGTGIEHTIENPSSSDVRLLVVGERLDTAHLAAEALLALWNDPGLATLADVFTEEATREDLNLGETAQGRAAIATALRARAGGFGAGAFTLRALVPSARQLALRWAWTREGQADAEVQGLALAELKGRAIHRIVESSASSRIPD